MGFGRRERIGGRELQQLVEEIRGMTTTRLIARIVHFLCHKLMMGQTDGGPRPHAAGPERDAEWESKMFVRIYESYADLYAWLRRKRTGTLFHLPIMMLVLRAGCETLFKDMYLLCSTDLVCGLSG